MLKAGFARGNINPMMGADISGYYKERKADGILDDLEVNALALECGEEKVVLVCLDHCGIKQNLICDFHDAIVNQRYFSTLMRMRIFLIYSTMCRPSGVSDTTSRKNRICFTLRPQIAHSSYTFLNTNFICLTFSTSDTYAVVSSMFQ